MIERRKRWERSIALLSLWIIPLWGASADAQSCDPATAFGVCSDVAVDIPLPQPFSVTVVESEGEIIVADLFSGEIARYLQSDLTAPPVVEMGPLGAVPIYGIVWHPPTGELLWLYEDPAGIGLARPTTGGALLSSGPLGTKQNYVSLSWSSDSNSLWTLAYTEDAVAELALDGTLLSFAIPFSMAPHNREAYGLGVTVIDTPGPEVLFDVASGAPSSLRADRIDRIHSTGASTGLGYPLTELNQATGWITDIAWSPSGSTGVASTYVVDLTETRLIELPTPTIDAGVRSFQCSVNSSGDRVLTWDVLDSTLPIAIQRSGSPLEALPPGTTTYTDSTDLPAGTYEYSLVSSPASVTIEPLRCSVTLGPGAPLLQADFVSVNPFAVTVIESLNRIAIVESSGGSAYLYDKDLLPDGQSIPSPFTGGDLTTGLAWNSTADELMWLNGDQGLIQRTDLAGAPIGGAISLGALSAGLLGDISFSPATGTYFGVVVDAAEIFEFDALGTILSVLPIPDVDGEPAIAARGVAVVADAGELTLDLAVGPASSMESDRVIRLVDGVLDPQAYSISTSTFSGAHAGIAWTPVGSNGLPSEYVITFDTGRIHEFDLGDLPPAIDAFRRGDVNLDQTVDIADPTSLLLGLFQGTGGAFQGGVFNCEDAADANDDGLVNIADAIQILEFLFVGGAPLPEPVECGIDPTDDPLDCVQSTSCA